MDATDSTTNHKSFKRKLNEYNIDILNEEDEPERKKRKLNNEINTLLESNQHLKNKNDELIQETDEYVEEINVFKQEANKWKSKYIKLYSKISEIAKMEARELETHDNSNKNAIISNGSNCKNKMSNKLIIETKKKVKDGLDKNKDINNIKIKRQKTVLNNDIMRQKIETSNNKIDIKHNTKSNKLIKRTDEMNKKNVKFTEKSSNNETHSKYNEIRDQLFQMGFDKTQVTKKLSLYNNLRENPEFNQLISALTSDTNGSRQLPSNTKRNRRKKSKRPNFNNTE